MIAIVNFSLRNYSDDSFVCMIKSLNIGFNESIDEISTEKMTFYFASRNHYRQHLWKKKIGLSIGAICIQPVQLFSLVYLFGFYGKMFIFSGSTVKMPMRANVTSSHRVFWVVYVKFWLEYKPWIWSLRYMFSCFLLGSSLVFNANRIRGSMLVLERCSFVRQKETVFRRELVKLISSIFLDLVIESWNLLRADCTLTSTIDRLGRIRSQEKNGNKR